MYTVYILRTYKQGLPLGGKSTLYTGITNNLIRRLSEHQSKGKKSAKYMKSFDSFKLVYTAKFENRSQALKREAEIKKLTKVKKEALINIS